MDLNRKEDIKELFKKAYRSCGVQTDKKDLDIKVRFYPYTSLKNTVRKRGNTIYVRISDILEDAPTAVLFSLGIILFCKLERKSPGYHQTRIYKDYVNSQKIQMRAQSIKKGRGNKMISGSKGRCYDLKDSFNRVNKRYFGGDMKIPNLTWSMRRTKTRFGHHDVAFNTIVISRTLDNARIPRYLLDYVMYHEMLHMKHKKGYKNGRQRIHTREFAEDEKRFSEYESAKSLLNKLSSGSFI